MNYKKIKRELVDGSLYVYNDDVSVKYQITMPQELFVELKVTSARRGMPLAEFIRETMEERLRRTDPSCETNPFASITGILNQAPSDLSERVDEILYQ